MLNDIISAGGSSFLIPVVLFVLVLYAFRGIFGLHGRRSQHRKEFLELWDSTRSQDDLWLEVSVRHLFGAYLPAYVIRLALAQPNKSQALLDLSELWPLFRFDPDSQTVAWLNRRHQTRRKRKAGRALLIFGYFSCALFGVASALVASQSGPNSFLGWTYGVFSVVSVFAAFICLAREETIKVAATVGDDWSARINRAAEQKAAKK